MKKIVGIDARMIEMSGIGTYIQHLMGNGIYDYALGDEEKIRRYDKDVKIIPYDAPIYSPKEQLCFPNQAVKKAKIELMHFPHYNVPCSYKGKYVVTVHDLTHIILPEFLGNRIKYIYAKSLMSHGLKKAEHVFTVSENTKKDIIRYFNIPEDKITITYNAIDDDFRVKEKKDIKYMFEKYNIPRNTKILLYVGNLKPHKNLETLLKALQRINLKDITLLLVGKAFEAVDLKSREEEMGIGDQVIHTGIVSKEELIDLYNLADVFVFPSLYEGFGLPPLEAMACGTPVVAANNSSIPEVVGNAALLIDAKDETEMADRITEIVYNNNLREELVSKGFVRINSFSWNKMVNEVRRVIIG